MTAPVGSLAAYLSVRGAAQARQDILSVQRQLGLAGEAAVGAGAGLDRTEAAMSGVGRASTVAAGRANQLRAAQLGVVAATERYNAVLTDEGATVGKVATSEASLIRAKERLASVTRVAAAEQAKATEVTRSAALANSEMVGSSGRGAAAMGGTVKQLGLMLGGFELLKKGVDIGKETAEFQRNMLLIQTNANASASEVKNMTAAVLSLAPEVATSPNELAQALYHVEQNGLRGKDALLALKVGAEGAKIGMANVEDTTNTMTIALASGIKGMGSMQQVMGRMIAIAGTGDMRLKDLNEALSGGILSVAKGFGATMGDVAAVLATLGDNGIRGADASTALRQTLMGFAAPAAKGKEALQGIGLTMTSLRDDMEKHGLVHAMNDLENHMTSAGVTGSKVGGFITEAFGRKAGAGISVLMGEIDRLNIKFDEGEKGAASFADKWTATTHTAAFAFKQFSVEIEAGGIKLATKALPAITAVGTALATGLPAGLHLAHEALTPFIAGWNTLSGILPPVGHALADVGGFLAPMLPALKFVAADVLAMWVAFKGYQATRLAIHAIADGIDTLRARAALGLASMRAYATGSAESMQLYTSTVDGQLVGVAATTQGTSRVMQAEFAKIEASALETAAAIDRAAAVEAVAFADMTAASKTASDAQVLAADEAAAAATAQARTSALAAATTAAAAEESAAAIDEAGVQASIGWAGVAGPLLAVGVGVGLLVSLFHHSASASKEAEAAAKAYTEALHDDSGKTNIVDSITKQLTDNKVPDLLNKLNGALGRTEYSGKQFVDAIERGGKPLDGLRSKLHGVLAEFKSQAARDPNINLKPIAAQADAAARLLKVLNTQYDALTAAAKKDLVDTKAFAGASSSIDKLSDSTKVGSTTAKTYAEMLGIVVDKNGIAAVSAKTLQAAVDTVSNAYDKATQTGDDYLKAVSSFSSSAGTAADRAALIGATLKAANGDALNYTSAMVGTVAANKALADGLQADSDKIAGLKQQIKQLEHPMKGQKVDTDALAKAQKDLADAYENSEAKAIDANKGTIIYTKGGASQLVSQLQAIQDAAVKAAAAQYQHEKATKGGTVAADDAYKTYKSQTLDALTSEAKNLGLTNDQAKRFATTYFGLADAPNIEKTIKALGTDPVVTVLDKIGRMLAKLTGSVWDIPVAVSVHNGLPTHKGSNTGPGGQASGGGYASGTTSATAGWHRVGEYGPEWMLFSGGEKVIPNGQSPKSAGVTHVTVNQVINNPVPETVSTSGPAGVRRSALALGR